MESLLKYPAFEIKIKMVGLLPWRQQTTNSWTKNSVRSTLMSNYAVGIFFFGKSVVFSDCSYLKVLLNKFI